MYKWHNTILPSIAIIFGSINILCMLVMWEQTDLFSKIAALVYTVLAVVCYKESKRKARESEVSTNGNIN